MSTSLLYHAFGVSGVKYTSTEYSKGQVRFHAEVTQNHQCSRCSGMPLIFKGSKIRSLHLPPIGKKSCFLDLVTHRVECKECGHLCWPHLSFVQNKRRMTRSFARYVG
ncbi:MAG: transposase, partial [Chlamydiales bacterium]